MTSLKIERSASANTLVRRLWNMLWHHKFVTFCLGFIVYMLLLSGHSLLRILQLEQQEDALRREIAEYRDSITHFQMHIDELNEDGEALERLARERLHMVAADEDLYLINE